MILDLLSNAPLYAPLDPRLKRGLDFLLRGEDEKLPPGKHAVEGDQLLAIIEEYSTRPLSQIKFEAHRRYWDIQCVRRGAERMGYVNLSQTSGVLQEHDTEKDFALHHGSGDFITVRAGMFVVFTPQDAHAPGLAVDLPAPVRKVVMKVQMT
jgi:YhcH/YjgK/YiaL family protein